MLVLPGDGRVPGVSALKEHGGKCNRVQIYDLSHHLLDRNYSILYNSDPCSTLFFKCFKKSRNSLRPALNMSDVLKKIFGNDRKTFRHIQQKNSNGPHLVNHI